MTTLHTFLEPRLNRFIDWISNLEKCKQNKEAYAKLNSFRDVPWTIGFCRDIHKQFVSSPDSTVDRLIMECSMSPADFNKEERQKIQDYITCFVEACNQ